MNKRPRHYAAEIVGLPDADQAAAIAATPWPGLVGDHVADYRFRREHRVSPIETMAAEIVRLPTTLQRLGALAALPEHLRDPVGSRVRALSESQPSV